MTLFYASMAEVSVDGRPLSDRWAGELLRVVVDDHLLFPAMFELAFRDPDGEGLGAVGLNIGAEVKISAVSGNGSKHLVTGEVTALEAEFDRSGSLAVARGYDLAHRLHRGRKTCAWLEKADDEIVKELAAGANIPIGDVRSVTPVQPYVLQANQTDWEFMRARARETGIELDVSQGRLDYKPPTKAKTAPGKGTFANAGGRRLVFGENLSVFRPRVTAAEQVANVEVRGWDAAKKQAIVASAAAKTVSASVGLDPAALAGKFGGGTYVSIARSVTSVDEAKSAAKALAERVASAAIEAEGVADGNHELRAGAAVNISNVGPPFNGRYVLSATRHVFDPEGYQTQFTISGRHERSLLGLASGGNGNGQSAHMRGVVIGLVTDMNDPKHEGRVKVKLPSISSDYSTDWVRVAYPGAGTNRGFINVPEVDDEVLVAFAGGDVRQPYIVGSLFNGKDKPKDGSAIVSSGKVQRRGMMSRVGHVVELRDDDSDGGVFLKATGSSGDEKLELNAGGHKITIKSGGAVEIESSGTVSIKATTSLSITAGTELKLSGAQVKISGDAGVEIASSGTLTLKGTSTELKGEAMVTVGSSGICTIQGALVKIN
ncbi:MAG: Rhs element Vgr protein [Actinomycetia bacterium]|nr:Rhs element Vgr protein [Actinomycetes bacterium]